MDASVSKKVSKTPQWTGRADEPDDQGCDRQAISLRIPRSTRSPSRRLRRSLQLRPATEDPWRPRPLRVRLQPPRRMPADGDRTLDLLRPTDRRKKKKKQA